MNIMYNHMIFLDAEGRNSLHEGKEVEGNGFLTIINMDMKKLDFSSVKEMVCKYKINSFAKKSEVLFEKENQNEHIIVNFNPKKLKIDMDDILDINNNGKEKIVFSVISKNEINYICLSDIKTMQNNYVFLDEINNFSEQEKI